MKKFDAVIIGFGKGGKTLATDLASRGMKVAMIEKSDKMYGGSCPNVGCVPTKFLVNKSEISRIKDFKSFDEKAEFYAAAIAEKKKLREMILGKMFSMLDGNPNVTLYTGVGRFVSASEVEITGKDFKETVSADKIVVDTGSTPFVPPIEGLRESKNVYVSEGMLELEKLPKRLVIIGGGNIGLEFASIYRRFGSNVTVLQDLTEFFPNEDDDVAKCIRETMDAEGVKFEFGVKISSVRDTDGGTVVSYSVDGEERSAAGDAVLVSTGRKPNIELLNLEAAGIRTTPRGAIETTKTLRTSNPRVWAIGDVAGGAQFTYISLDDYRIVLSDMTGGARTNEDRSIPYCVFLSPSLARVGLTEKAARAQGYNIKTASLSPRSVPRCHSTGRYTGILKAVVDADTDMILGASLYCDEAHEMINLVKFAMDCKAPYTALRDHIYTHPVMTEALSDLFMNVK